MIELLVVAALAVMTLAIGGFARLPTLLLQLHAAAKIGAVGIVLLSVAAAIASGAFRPLLVGAFVLLTAPVSSHVLAALGEQEREG